METIRWGIIGPGRIAHPVVQDLTEHVPGARVVAVGSRALGRAEEFARMHGVDRAYGSYREVLQDPEVDAVYVATPHPQHHAIALAAIRAGTPVLVEKAFTATLAGAREVVDAARRREVFCMEAMKTPFYPAVQAMLDLVADGVIGQVRGVDASFGFPAPDDPTSRLRAPELGGGPLLDIGIYAVSFAELFLGLPQELHVVGARMDTGVDQEATMLLDHGQGRASTLACSLGHTLPGSARVVGTDGWLEVPRPFHQPDRFTVHLPAPAGRDVEVTEHRAPPTGHGFTHELIEATEAIRAGRTESTVLPLARTLAIQGVLEDAAAQLGVRFTEDADVDI